MNKRVLIGFSVCALMLLSIGTPAFAHPGGITTPDPTLPPDGVYLTPYDVHATYSAGALTVVLSAVQHQPFALLDPNDFTQCGSAGTPEVCEDHHFSSGLDAMVSINGGTPSPIHMEGDVETRAVGRSAVNQPGTFDTEMLSMSLIGPGNIRVRESPTLQSLGQTSIIPQGGGMYHIDSFFDVFTELSIDGGNNWIPQSEPGGSRVYLSPEPTSVVLLAMGLLGCAGMARRRK